MVDKMLALICAGGHSGGETPGHIPNPEAKPTSADGTAPARVWESRTPPDQHHTETAHPNNPGGPFLHIQMVARPIRVLARSRCGGTPAAWSWSARPADEFSMKTMT